MARKTYTVVVTTSYEATAADEVDAQFAACALASGCQSGLDRIGTPRHIGRVNVKAVSSVVVSTTERKTADQIIAEFGVKTEEKEST